MDEIRKALQGARKVQIERITKGFDEIGEADNIEKGIYVDNPENRRLNRVGQTYGGKKEVDKPATKYYTEVDEEFVDEDTGDIIKMKRQGITDEGRKALEGVLKEVKAKHIDAIQTQNEVTNTLYDKWTTLELKLSELKTSVKDLSDDKIEFEVDMEEEYGKAPIEEHDSIGNKYGEVFNEIKEHEKILHEEISKTQPLVEAAHEEYTEARDTQSDMIHKMKDEQREAVKAFEKKHGYKK